MAFVKKTINAARFNVTKHRKEEVNDEPSMTIPNESMPLKDILERFGSGRAIPTAIQAIYEEEGKEILDTSMMSKVEKAEMAQALSQEVFEARQKLKQLEAHGKYHGTKYVDPNAKPPITEPTPEPTPDA